jgi:hypothetical protein
MLRGGPEIVNVAGKSVLYYVFCSCKGLGIPNKLSDLRRTKYPDVEDHDNRGFTLWDPGDKGGAGARSRWSFPNCARDTGTGISEYRAISTP